MVSPGRAGSLPPVATLDVVSSSSGGELDRTSSPEVVSVESFLRRSAAASNKVTYRKRKRKPPQFDEDEDDDEDGDGEDDSDKRDGDYEPPKPKRRRRIVSMRPQGSFYPRPNPVRSHSPDPFLSTGGFTQSGSAPPPLTLFPVLDNSADSPSQSPRKTQATQSNPLANATFAGTHQTSPRQEHARKKPATSWRLGFDNPTDIRSITKSPKTPRRRNSPEKSQNSVTPLSFVSLEEHRSSYSNLRRSARDPMLSVPRSPSTTSPSKRPGLSRAPLSLVPIHPSGAMSNLPTNSQHSEEP